VIMKKITFVLSFLAVTTVGASATSLFSDDFNYLDGSITTVSGGIWANHSGTAGQVDVQSGMVNLTSTESEDVNALITGGPYTSGFLYYSLNVNFSVLPNGAGNYFAHFKDSSTGFRARLFTTTVGAAPGFYRLGINNGSTPISATFSSDLALGTWHMAVVRYDAGAVATTLWVDPVLETDPSVSATDVVTGIGVSAIALRQSRTTGPVDMGTLVVDGLKVATSFVEVVPEPTGLLPLGLLGLLVVRRFRRRN
jgi:MYXO-CTERM domain-containing protein